MKLEINTECMESLFLAMLVQDYKFNEENIVAMKQIKEDFGELEDFQKEDYKYYKQFKKTLKKMLCYYTTDGGVEALGGAV